MPENNIEFFGSAPSYQPKTPRPNLRVSRPDLLLVVVLVSILVHAHLTRGIVFGMMLTAVGVYLYMATTREEDNSAKEEAQAARIVREFLLHFAGSRSSNFNHGVSIKYFLAVERFLLGGTPRNFLAINGYAWQFDIV